MSEDGRTVSLGVLIDVENTSVRYAQSIFLGSDFVKRSALHEYNCNGGSEDK